MEVLKTLFLNISVWQNNTFGRNSFLGEVDLDMSIWDFSNTHINEYTLKARVKDSFLYTICVFHRSDLLDGYSLCLNPSVLRTKSNSVSLTSERQQRTNESRPEIPSPDIPQWADDSSDLINSSL